MLKKREPEYSGPTIKKKSSSMANLAAELLAGVTKTHMSHLKTTSYAAHMALGEFYEALPDMVDNIVEQYQGVTEELLSYPAKTVEPLNTPEEAVEYLRKLYQMVSAYQSTCMYSEIVNELDLIKSCINKAKYKLIFLK